jgi:hypothetical protein
MPYYAIPGEDAALFVHGNCVESKHYIMVEKNGKTEAWDKAANCICTHIYTIDHDTKTITFGPDFEQVYVWCIGGRFPFRPVLFKIEPKENN